MAEGLKDSGHEVDVLTCLPNYPKGRIYDGYRRCISKKETINGIKVFMYWSFSTITKNPILRTIGMLSFAVTLWIFAFKFRKIRSYDCVIIQTPPILVAFSAILLFKILYRKKTVLNVSDLWPISAVELGAIRENSKTHKMLAKIEIFLYKHSNAIQGQSNEILEHIQKLEPTKKLFLYRNLQKVSPYSAIAERREKPFRIVYAGLLGVAQGIYELLQNIDFKKLDVEFHIYGGGNQTKLIEDYIKNNPDKGVYYHGFLPKQDINTVLPQYHASIVPLLVRIRGAVPSKIFDLLPHGVPILFCGGGEGAEIVKKFKFGFTSNPGNYKELESNIKKLYEMDYEDYRRIVNNCISASKEEFSYDYQMKKYIEFLNMIIKN